MIMQIKIFDEENEEDLENKAGRNPILTTAHDLLNSFCRTLTPEDKKVLDIKYSVAILLDGGEQIYCYSSLIMYE